MRTLVEVAVPTRERDTRLAGRVLVAAKSVAADPVSPQVEKEHAENQHCKDQERANSGHIHRLALHRDDQAARIRCGTIADGGAAGTATVDA